MMKWMNVSFPPLMVYESMQRKKVALTPVLPNRFNMFVCGPTVYDETHIGHGRAYSFYDIMARWLRTLGYSVFYLQNITDIDDKIIKRANDENRAWKEIALEYEEKYMEAMEALNITSVNLYARATEHIPEIISQVRRLIDSGHAYILDDGIYFDVSSFPEYGKLSQQELRDLKPGARVEVKGEKKTPYDFVLWKFRKPNEPYWDSPWGEGRPGWHIEDTAIAERYLGVQYDIHGGGEDLVFPHHECEIAQMESISGVKPMVRYWVHISFLTIRKEKMSKSLGNIIPIRDAVKKWGGEALRLFYATSIHTQPQDFDEGLLDSAKSALEGIYRVLYDLERKEKEGEENQGDERVESQVNIELQKFVNALSDDFNTPVALASLHAAKNIAMEYISRDHISLTTIRTLRRAMTWMGSILGIFREVKKPVNLEHLLELFISIRNELRQRRMYELADKIRDELNKIGIVLEDSKRGTTWYAK
ncbi:MAG: cysteine--tRNA ligase, partial [Candidatus Korarchaeota archaeon]